MLEGWLVLLLPRRKVLDPGFESSIGRGVCTMSPCLSVTLLLMQQLRKNPPAETCIFVVWQNNKRFFLLTFSALHWWKSINYNVWKHDCWVKVWRLQQVVSQPDVNSLIPAFVTGFWCLKSLRTKLITVPQTFITFHCLYVKDIIYINSKKN